MRILKNTLRSKYLKFILGFLIALVFLVNNFLIVKTSKYNLNENIFTGKILKYKIDGNKLSLTIKGKEKLAAIYYIEKEEEKFFLQNHIKEGITINVKGELVVPLNNTIPNTFNYKKYLNNNNIFYTLKIKDLKIVNNQIPFINKVKDKICKKIETYKSKDYLKIFILGDKNDIEHDLYNNYQKIGVAHLFAISGMHVSLLSGILYFILNKIVDKKMSFFITGTILFFYTILLSFSASILRALISFIVFGVNRLFRLKISSFDLMLIVLFIAVVINYKLVFNLGFQYSYICSLGIIMSKKFLSKGKNYITKIFLVSFIATLFSLPLTAINFYEINGLSIISNIFFVPLITFIIYPLALLTLIIPICDQLLFFIINIMELLSNIMLNFFVFQINIPKVFWLTWVVYYLLLYKYISNRKYIYGIIFLIFLVKMLPFIDFNYYVYFIDVGQGDCAVIQSANNQEVIMIDTGGKIKFKQETWEEQKNNTSNINNVILFLKSIGIKKIDLLILTHGDYDHMGDSHELIEKFKVKSILINKDKKNELESNIKTELIVDNYKSKKINYQIIVTDKYDNENDNSIVTIFKIGSYKFLFTGDIGKKVEKDIITKYLLEIDFLKLAHHGSKTSNSEYFLESINPKVGIISSGRNNNYNHPAQEVVNTLQKLDIKYFNTAKDGTIKFKIREKTHTITTFKP